jgi:hypothetical protein
MAKDKDKAMKEYKAARAALDANCRRERAAGVRDQTRENRAAQRRVIEAEKHVSFWRR